MLNAVPLSSSTTKVVPALSCPTINPVAPEPACVTGSPVWNLPPDTVPPVKLSCAYATLIVEQYPATKFATEVNTMVAPD